MQTLPHVVLLFLVAFALTDTAAVTETPRIVSFGGSSALAAKEARRYIYSMTKLLPSISPGLAAGVTAGPSTTATPPELVIVGAFSDLPPAVQQALKWVPKGIDAHVVRPVTYAGQSALVCTGGSTTSTLYAVYSMVELHGARFYLHGDVLPWGDKVEKLQAVDGEFAAHFAKRGINPYHDFPMGPDWWQLQDYEQFAAQMLKMKLNVWTFHSYRTEPLVWVGKPEGHRGTQVQKVYDPEGSMPWFDSACGGWGVNPKNLSDFTGGSRMFFASKHGFSFGSQIRKKETPAGKQSCQYSAEEQAAFYNDAAAFMESALSFSKQLGIENAVGHEFPLNISYPFTANDTEAFYQGTYERLHSALPSMDRLVLWTSEGAQDPKSAPMLSQDFARSMTAMKNAGLGDKEVATCGWGLGGGALDKLLPDGPVMSSLDGNVGWDDVDPTYAELKHAKWVMPWLEDDPGLGGPELWVNRTLQHARDALRYGASGLVGITWRTREIGPQLSALAQFAWNSTLADDDVYADFCRHSFGMWGPNCTNVFMSMDSFKTPPPKTGDRAGKCDAAGNPWGPCKTNLPRTNMGCCGRISAGPVGPASDWNFADTFEALRSEVTGGVENLERFEYWSAQFRYFAAFARVELIGFDTQNFVEELSLSPDPKTFAANNGPPLLKKLSRAWEQMTTILQRSVSSTGTLGTLIYNEAANFKNFFPPLTDVLKQYDVPVTPDLLPSTSYQGEPRLFAPAVQTLVRAAGWCVRATAVGLPAPVLATRRMGGSEVLSTPMENIGGDVYKSCVTMRDDFEWRISAGTQRIPLGAAWQTVVVLSDASDETLINVII